ncbi:septum formation initiator family protein [Ideonella sp.]|jgi:cell division protein FtsB|uniref:septum formation initiator family protein n=1 Tax=Ideonella sp. TaxID=1929293 RepID=UPI0037BE2C80
MRIVPFVFAALLLLVHAELWLGKGGVPHAMSLRSELTEQRARNDEARARNERLMAEVADLKDGVEIVEERARLDMGMIKPDEVLVVVAPGSR